MLICGGKQRVRTKARENLPFQHQKRKETRVRRIKLLKSVLKDSCVLLQFILDVMHTVRENDIKPMQNVNRNK